jgi:hypothetical protein
MIKGSLWHPVSAFGKRMRIQSQLGQTKVDFNNQGKNALQCLSFRLDSKLKLHAAKSWNGMSQRAFMYDVHFEFTNSKQSITMLLKDIFKSD